MPYTHYSREERDALQVMEGMRLPRWNIAVILGKHISAVYRELVRNADGGGYTPLPPPRNRRKNGDFRASHALKPEIPSSWGR
jgi:IS30 family transposase